MTLDLVLLVPGISDNDPLDGATLTLSPSSATPFVNVNQVMTATLLDEDSNPIEGETITFTVSGAHSGSDTAVTNASGVATYTFTQSTNGTDSVVASIEDIASNIASIRWYTILEEATLVLTPPSVSPYINANQVITATLLDHLGSPISGQSITFTRTGVNSSSGNDTTNGSGVATYTITSTLAGADSITATLAALTSNAAVVTWSIEFLLNDQFTDTDAAPITLPRTATPTGALTGSDASNVLSVGSGVLNVAADAGTPTVYLYDAQRARVAGLAAMWSFNPLVAAASLAWRWAFDPANTQASPTTLAWRVASSGVFTLVINASIFPWSVATALTNNTPETIAIIQFSNRNEFYRLISGNWLLVWVDYSITTANMYAGMARAGATQAHTQDNYRTAILGAASTNLYAQLIGNISAGATSAARNGNCLIAFDLDTLPSANSIKINFRKQDANNYWQLDLSSAPTATLYEVVAGTPTSRASAAVTTGKGRIIADGTTIPAYDDNAQLFSYASASNFQASTAIEVSSLGTGGAISDMDVFDRYAQASTPVDANLDALAAG